ESVATTDDEDGRADLENAESFEIDAFWRAAQQLPTYAPPRFVRLLVRLSTTGTFKIQKSDLRSEGVDPARVSDTLYVRTDAGYQRLTPKLWASVTEGRLRL